MNKLRKALKHQRRVLRRCKGIRRLPLFMQMRLGKTLCSIRWLKGECENPTRVLIVVPLTTLPTWKVELELEQVSPSKILMPSGRLKDRPALIRKSKAVWILTNYEALVRCPAILDVGYTAVILDESTLIRSPKSKTAQILCARTKNVIYKAILAGLPNPESVHDFFMQFKFLDGHFMGYDNYWSWRKRFFQRFGYEWAPRKGTRSKINAAVHERAVVLSREQAGIGEKKIHTRLHFQKNAAQLKAEKEILTSFSWGDLETKYIPVQYAWLMRLAGGFTPDGKECINSAKCDEIIHLLEGDLKGEQLVIWFRFSGELKFVLSELRAKKYKATWIDGDTPTPDRRKLQDQFNAKQYQVICMQTKTGRFGMDLSVADVAIYYSNYFENELRRQSEDRIVHPIKKRPLMYIDLETVDSADEDIRVALQEKQADADTYRARVSDMIKRRLGRLK